MISSRARTTVTVSLLLFGSGLLPGPGQAQQQLAQADRGPRFLALVSRGATPVPIDMNATPVLRHRIALSRDEATLGQLLSAIRQQTGLKFVYSTDVVPVNKTIGLRAESITVAAALTEILLDASVDVVFYSAREAGLVPRKPPVVGSLSGAVTEARTGQAVFSAEVELVGTNWRTLTDTKGRYRLTDVTAASYTIAVRRVGYVKRSQAVVVRESEDVTVNFALEPSAVNLDEIVVSGTAAEQAKRSMGNVVGKVAVADIVQLAPPTKLQDMLSVNVPGVRVFRSSGAVGGGGPTRIRGSGSLSLSNEPLIYVDGIRVNNDPAVSNDARTGFYDRTSRVNDLNPEEIESIEVLKGPSAATIYGTEASNGVIQIITRRGRARPTIDMHADAGANWLQNPEGRYPANYYVGRTDGLIHEFKVLEFRKTACADPALNCYTHLFRTGTPLGLGASLGGGTERLRYYFSLDAGRDEGYFSYNWQNKYNGRANLTYSSTNDKFKADVSLGLVRSRTRVADAVQPQTSSIVWACRFPGCEPDPASPTNTGWNGPRHGFARYYPEAYDHAFGFDNVDRSTVSLKLSHRPFQWLRHQLTIGPDFTNNRSSVLVERDPSGLQPFFDASFGLKAAGLNQSTFVTVDYGAAADWNVSRSLISTTSVGAQYYYKQFDVIHGEGRRFSIPGESDITSASQRSASESYLENKNVGVYVQEQLALKNRFFVTAAVRGDDNSAFGSNFDAVVYPKLSFSWVLSEEPMFANSKVLSQLKLRAAWGRAGLAPDVFSAIRSYTGEVGPGGEGGVSPQNLGNLNLKPEVGQETEVGFDAGLFNQRIGIEFTFYNKDVKDAIVSVPNRPSRGFPGNTFLNLGKTRNRGIELAIDGTPISGNNLSLDLRGTIATNSTNIIDMGGLAPIFTGGSYVSQWNVQGFAPGAFFYRRVVSSTVERRVVSGIQLPVGVNPICEGGTDLGYGDGSEVPCASAPRIYRGRPTPSWNGSFSATLTLGKRLRILGLLDYLGGNTVSVGDVGAMHTFFLNSKQVLDGSDPVLSGYLGTMLLQGDANATGAVGLFKGGFLKLRTVSASYDLPTKIARWTGASRGSITVSGENLAILWREQAEAFGVPWVDPEISSNNAASIGGSNSGYIQESFPQAARIRTTIRLTF